MKYVVVHEEWYPVQTIRAPYPDDFSWATFIDLSPEEFERVRAAGEEFMAVQKLIAEKMPPEYQKAFHFDSALIEEHS